jgi:hypothetical protein
VIYEYGLAECRLVVLPRAAISMATSANLEVEGAVDLLERKDNPVKAES